MGPKRAEDMYVFCTRSQAVTAALAVQAEAPPCSASEEAAEAGEPGKPKRVAAGTPILTNCKADACLQGKTQSAKDEQKRLRTWQASNKN